MTTKSLREALKKRNAFECPEQEVALNLLRTADRVHSGFQKLFKSHGLTEQQYNVLRILRGTGAPLPCLEIAQRMITRLPDITRLLDRLENSGYVERKRCTKDRRVVFIAITEQALQLLAQLDAPVTELHRAQLGHLTKSELKQLTQLLEKARERLEDG